MSSVLLYSAGVIVIFIGLALSIALHELGHLIPAKKFGVRVKQYMIGFGPTIFSRQKGETEYGLKALPLGGYISMIGMFPPSPKDAPGTLRDSTTGMFSSLAEGARSYSAEEIEPGDEGRLFYELPVYKRVIIMMGGPVMNLLIAFVLMSLLITMHGVSTPTTKVASVSECVISVQQTQNQNTESCSASDPKSPAATAGITVGDQIVAFNGQPVSTWDDASAKIRAAAGQQVDLTVIRNGQKVHLSVKPMLTARPETDALGMPIKDRHGNYVTQDVGFLGISPTSENQKKPFIDVFPMLGDNIVAVGKIILNLPQRMMDVARAAFTSEPRDPNGPMSVVGVGRVAGEIASTDQVSVSDKLASMIGMIASLNIAFFVFNLVPLLPLDGGHVAGALWEAIRRFIAKLRGKPDPGPFDTAKMLPLTYVVAALLMAMSVLLIYADIVKPITLFK
ncbi:MAG: site-2 protease family protein [Micrococcaceae bacterium]